jgi:serine O-acetyltransferase
LGRWRLQGTINPLNQSLDTETLTRFVTNQVNNWFPDSRMRPPILSAFVKKAIKRIEYCFSRVNNKYFFDGKTTQFNHLHSDQYAMFLYYLSNTIWQDERDVNLASKVYYLNKALHGLDAFYEAQLPDICLFVHCVGTVLGRAEYQDYFVAYQRVTVGGNNRKYPTLGKGIVMYGNSALIGNSNIGDNCFVSYGTVVVDETVPPNKLVFGRSPEITLKETRKSVIERFFLA